MRILYNTILCYIGGLVVGKSYILREDLPTDGRLGFEQKKVQPSRPIGRVTNSKEIVVDSIIEIKKMKQDFDAFNRLL